MRPMFAPAQVLERGMKTAREVSDRLKGCLQSEQFLVLL